MMGLGMQEIVVILVVALVFFGPRKLPELGRSLGRTMNEFKKASNELRNTLEDEVRVEEQREQRAKEAERNAAAAPTTTAALAPVEDEVPAPAPTPTDEPTVSRTSTSA